MKIVLDTNVFISGLFFPKSNAGRILNSCIEGKFSLCLSEELLSEIEKVLFYPKIRKRLKLSQLEIENYCSLLRFQFEIFNIKNIKANVVKDKNDNHILATFIASNADFLITGDDDLLSMSDEYRIVSLSEFVKKYF